MIGRGKESGRGLLPLLVSSRLVLQIADRRSSGNGIEADGDRPVWYYTQTLQIHCREGKRSKADDIATLFSPFKASWIPRWDQPCCLSSTR